MDGIIEALSASSLGGGQQKLEGLLNVYISEVSSPTRLWIQNADSQDLDSMTKNMNDFYNQHGQDAFAIKPDQVELGMRIVSNEFQQYDRAEIIGGYNSSTGRIRLFFIDYGTTGKVLLSCCKFIMEPFRDLPKKAIRGSLAMIKPIGNTRLWDLETSLFFINEIRNKSHRIRITKYHSQEDFYEFFLFDGNSDSTVNEKLINKGLALKVENGETPSCVAYPSFALLEKLVTYPTLDDRYLLQSDGIDFNHFEEYNVPAESNAFSWETELDRVLSDEKFSKERGSFIKILGL